MGGVIERHSVKVGDDGYIHYDDQPTDWEQAETIAGQRLDRRKNYAIINGEVYESCKWTEKICECEGACFGFCTGTRTRAEWVPLVLDGG